MDIETQEAVSALKAAVKECQDVLDKADARTDASLAGRGYESIRDVMSDAVRINTNLLKRLGEAPTLPQADPEPAPAPEAEPEGPPEELAGFFEGKPHGMAAQELLDECTRLGHLVQMGQATKEQADKHTVLLRHQPYLRSAAVEVI